MKEKRSASGRNNPISSVGCRSGRRSSAKMLVFMDCSKHHNGVVIWNHNIASSENQQKITGTLSSPEPHHQVHTSTRLPVYSETLDHIPVDSSPPRPIRSMSRSPPTPVYAGAKFSEAPSPKVLPKPPVRWMETKLMSPALIQPRSCGVDFQRCDEMTNTLKGLLKVQC